MNILHSSKKAAVQRRAEHRREGKNSKTRRKNRRGASARNTRPWPPGLIMLKESSSWKLRFKSPKERLEKSALGSGDETENRPDRIFPWGQAGKRRIYHRDGGKKKMQAERKLGASKKKRGLGRVDPSPRIPASGKCEGATKEAGGGGTKSHSLTSGSKKPKKGKGTKAGEKIRERGP